MSYILNIADYIYNSICIITNNVYNFFNPTYKIIKINNDDDNINNTIPPIISEDELNLSDNSDNEENEENYENEN